LLVYIERLIPIAKRISRDIFNVLIDLVLLGYLYMATLQSVAPGLFFEADLIPENLYLVCSVGNGPSLIL
jgi:hypothetical protein